MYYNGNIPFVTYYKTNRSPKGTVQLNMKVKVKDSIDLGKL